MTQPRPQKQPRTCKQPLRQKPQRHRKQRKERPPRNHPEHRPPRPPPTADCWRQLRAAPVNAAARATGLVRRAARKIQAVPLLKTLCALAVGQGHSCRDVALGLGLATRQVPSRPAVWARLKGHGQALVEAVLAGRLATRCATATVTRALPGIKRLLVQDSSVLTLPRKLYAQFSGVGNGRTTSCQARVQALYDLLAERFVAFRVDPYSRNDLTAAGDVLPLLRAGDLLMRDLGYFVTPVFAAIEAQGAFFLSRLSPGPVLLDPVTHQRINLLARLRKVQRLDCPVLLGAKAQFPVRLIAEPVPPAVGETRRRQRRAQNKRTNDTATTLALMDWSLYVTNLPATQVTAAQVLALYALRWRIECIFKVWKSYLNFTAFHALTLKKLYLTLACRLLAVTLFHRALVPAFTNPCPGSTPEQAAAPAVSLQLVGKLFRLLAGLAMGGVAPTRALVAELVRRLCVYDTRRRPTYYQQLQRLLAGDDALTMTLG